jgi:hypothetical protein
VLSAIKFRFKARLLGCPSALRQLGRCGQRLFTIYELIVNETALESLPLHEVVDTTPIALETNVVPPCGGLKTKTATVPAFAMSSAVMTAIS